MRERREVLLLLPPGRLEFSISLTLFLGFGAAIFVGEATILEANPGGNMAAPLLAEAIGGNLLFAFICAVAFATILAVVAGLVLSGASALAHDIYGQIIKKGRISDQQQMRAARFRSIRSFSSFPSSYPYSHNI